LFCICLYIYICVYTYIFIYLYYFILLYIIYYYILFYIIFILLLLLLFIIIYLYIYLFILLLFIIILFIYTRILLVSIINKSINILLFISFKKFNWLSNHWKSNYFIAYICAIKRCYILFPFQKKNAAEITEIISFRWIYRKNTMIHKLYKRIPVNYIIQKYYKVISIIFRNYWR